MSIKTPLLKPYRSIGLFLDDNRGYSYHIGKKSYLAMSTGRSFKVYKMPEFKVKLLGPNLPNKVRAVSAHNENIFLAAGNNIYQFQYYHLVNVFEQHTAKITSMTSIGEILLSGAYNGDIHVFDYKSPKASLLSFSVSFTPTAFLHPPTYLNKVLIVGKDNLELWNIRTGLRIYNFTSSDSNLYKLLHQQHTDSSSSLEVTDPGIKVADTASIVCVENSPALDIIALALTDGNIILLNLKQDKVLQNFKVSQARPLCLAFSQVDKPLLASADDQGNINVWDLNEGKIFSKIKSAHRERYVNYLEFVKDELQMVSGSAGDNSLKLWNYDEGEESKFVCLRERSGMGSPLKKLSFYGEEGHHVIAASSKEEAELKDFFLWNESFNGKFSLVT